MFKLDKKFLKTYLVLFLGLLFNEVIFKLINNNFTFNISFIRLLIELNLLASLFGYLFSLFNKRVANVLSGILIFIGSLYSFLQLGFNNYIGVYMSVNASSQLGAVKDYIVDFLKASKGLYYLEFIPFVLFIIYLFFQKSENPFKRNFSYKTYYQKHITMIMVFISVIASAMVFDLLLDDKYLEDNYQVVSNKDLFISASNPGLCIKEFGVMSFGIIDVKTKLLGTYTDASVYLAYDNKKTNTNREIDDTAWNYVIENETNQTLNNLNNYYINQDITDKNEYTGLFEGKNLIVIMMESVNDIIINEEYYPNFYKLYSEGWYFNNNYSPRNSCATGNNEFSAMTSLYSIYNSCTANVYQNNTYFNSIFNVFNNKGYVTNSFHDYDNQYYSRTTIHPNMGSQNYYGAKELGITYEAKYGVWADDNELMTKYLEQIDLLDSSQNFMSYITTVSSHQPYYSSLYGNMYYDLTEGTGYSDNIRHYMSKLKVLDNALGVLIDGLEERGILDDTVIVLFGDHYPYGLPLNNLNEVLDRDLNDYENEKVPLVIYNPSLEAKEIDTYTSYINLLPTLANLFNLDYDPRLYAGSDILSEEYNNIVVFADSSWKNNLAYYNASTGKITYYTDFTYTDDEILKINSEIYAKMNASTLSIQNNYFNYLENAIKSYNERTDNY